MVIVLSSCEQPKGGEPALHECFYVLPTELVKTIIIWLHDDKLLWQVINKMR